MHRVSHNRSLNALEVVWGAAPCNQARKAAYSNMRTFDPAPCGEPYRGEAPDPHKDRRGRSPLLTGQVPPECKMSSCSRKCDMVFCPAC